MVLGLPVAFIRHDAISELQFEKPSSSWLTLSTGYYHMFSGFPGVCRPICMFLFRSRLEVPGFSIFLTWAIYWISWTNIKMEVFSTSDTISTAYCIVFAICHPISVNPMFTSRLDAWGISRNRYVIRRINQPCALWFEHITNTWFLLAWVKDTQL